MYFAAKYAYTLFAWASTSLNGNTESGVSLFFMAHPPSFQKLDKCLKIVIWIWDASIIKVNSPNNLNIYQTDQSAGSYTHLVWIIESKTFFMETQIRKTEGKKKS